MNDDLSDALVLYEQSVGQDPHNLNAYQYIASLHYRNRRYHQAEKAMEHVLDAFPDHFPSLKMMSNIQAALGRASDAADTMGAAYRVPGDRTHTGVTYVRLLLEAGRRDEAIQVMTSNPELNAHPRLRDVSGP